MEQAHMNVVRIGEFAWSTEEPSEGNYQFDWLQRAIDLAAKHHLKVVLGTPTDAPPAWLTQKYPDTLGTDANGRVREHGTRRQFSYSSPHYREFCRKIVLQLAQRFGHDPNILGWQIGNEYTDESFDPATKAEFQQFLKARFKTLDSLNAHWSTAYWSQTYTDWSQIPLEATEGNPGLLLEHKHFVTATWVSFQQNQIDVLKPLILPAQFITTNIGGLAWSDNWDHYAVTAPLTLATWDEYVGTGHLDAPKEAMLNDFVRGFRRQNFWIMETQPGSVNWAGVNNALAPGETRALAWQAVGHGADAILYWQWRPALNGQEQYHGSIVGPSGDPLPLYDEIKQLGHDFDLTRTAITGTQPGTLQSNLKSPRAPSIASSAMGGSTDVSSGNTIALLHTYDSRWAIDFQIHDRNYDQQQVLLRFYQPLARRAAAQGEQVDIIDPTQPGSLAQYKLLVAPSLNVIDDPLAAKLLSWVKQGGHLLLGPRSGMKDAYNALNPQRQPGPLAAALGAKVDQYYPIDHPITLHTCDASCSSANGAQHNSLGRSPRLGAENGQRAEGPTHPAAGSATIWAEALTPSAPGTHIDLTYSDPNGWLDNQPAMVTRPVGDGTLTYLGTIPDEATLLHLLTAKVTDATNGVPAWTLPNGVELCVRSKGLDTVTILINHRSTEVQIKTPGIYRDILNPKSPLTTLPPQGVAVLEKVHTDM
jgi:beta-galactosidase